MRKGGSSARRSLWSVWMLALLLVFAPLVSTGCLTKTGDDGGKWHLLSDLATDGQHLILKNGEPFIWKNPTITVNGEYSLKLSELPRGNTSLNLTDFKSADGGSFDPATQTMRSVSVSVPDVMGGKEGVWTW